jgi:hypothetical protein
MAHHIFQLGTELQNNPEAAPKASPSLSISEKLAGRPIFFLKPAWTLIPLWESASKLFHRFPAIIKQAQNAAHGDGFLVPVSGVIKKISQDN